MRHDHDRVRDENAELRKLLSSFSEAVVTPALHKSARDLGVALRPSAPPPGAAGDLHTKKATVRIGLLDTDTCGFFAIATGVLVSADGLVLTAAHTFLGMSERPPRFSELYGLREEQHVMIVVGLYQGEGQPALWRYRAELLTPRAKLFASRADGPRGRSMLVDLAVLRLCGDVQLNPPVFAPATEEVGQQAAGGPPSRHEPRKPNDDCDAGGHGTSGSELAATSAHSAPWLEPCVTCGRPVYRRGHHLGQRVRVIASNPFLHPLSLASFLPVGEPDSLRSGDELLAAVSAKRARPTPQRARPPDRRCRARATAAAARARPPLPRARVGRFESPPCACNFRPPTELAVAGRPASHLPRPQPRPLSRSRLPQDQALLACGLVGRSVACRAPAIEPTILHSTESCIAQPTFRESDK